MNDIETLLPQLSRLIPEDPAYWAEKLFYEPIGQKLWRHPDPDKLDQADIVSLPFRHQKWALGTGHAVAKSESTRLIIGLWMLAHWPETYIVVSSSSWPAVETVIFGGLRNMLSRIDPHKKVFPGVGAHRWRWNDKFAVIGISPNEPEIAQGWHSQNGTLILWDEASKIDGRPFESIMSVIKSRRDSIGLFGNAIRAEGPFADILRHERKYKDWWTGKISSEDTPNFRATTEAIARGEMTDEEARAGKEVIVIPGLATYSQVRNWEEQGNGRTSILFCSRVLGVPPDQSEDTLIPISAVENATRRPDRLAEETGLRILLDVAISEVGDQTALGVAGRYGLYEMDLHLGWGPKQMFKWIHDRVTGRGPVDFAGKPITEIRLDAAGSGGPIWRDLKDMQAMGEEWLQNIEIIPVFGGVPAAHETDYSNLRAECWGLMGEGLKTGFRIPPRYRDDLICMTAMKWGPDDKNRIKLEPKIKFKERVGYSPDGPDMLSFGFADFEEHQAWRGLVCEVHKAKFDVTLEKDREKWWVNFAGMPARFARSGHLYRTMFYSRRSDSGMLITHVDESGWWTVCKALKWKNKPLREIAGTVVQASLSYDFMTDWLTASEEIDVDDQLRVVDVMVDEFYRRGQREIPTWMEPSKLKGVAGLDVIDRLLLGTLARFPKHQFWEGRTDSPLTHIGSPALTIGAPDVWQELRRARFKKPTANAVWDEAARSSEDLVGGGGPLVLCLRMLAVGGVGVYV